MNEQTVNFILAELKAQREAINRLIESIQRAMSAYIVFSEPPNSYED